MTREIHEGTVWIAWGLVAAALAIGSVRVHSQEARKIRVLGFVPVEDRVQSFVARVDSGTDTEDKESVQWATLWVEGGTGAIMCGGDRKVPALAAFISRRNRWVRVTVETIPPPGAPP